MIAFPPERVARVRQYLTRDDAFVRIHKTISQSYKVMFAQVKVAQHIGAISFLFTGAPGAFGGLGEEQGLELAERLFARDPVKVPGQASRGLLYMHAHAVLTAETQKPSGTTRRGYIDWEASHLTLLGGELLFRRIVEALVTPYVDQPLRRLSTSAEATAADVGLFLRPEPMRAALEQCDHWSEWETLLGMAESKERKRALACEPEDQ